MTGGRDCRFLLGKLQVGEVPGLGHGQIPKFPKKEGGQDKVGRRRECLELDETQKVLGLNLDPCPFLQMSPLKKPPRAGSP